MSGRGRRLVSGICLAVLAGSVSCGGMSARDGTQKAAGKGVVFSAQPPFLEPYAREIGAELVEPRHRRFAVDDGRFMVAGTAAAYREFASGLAWIEVRKVGDEAVGSFDYYPPIHDGSFRQQVRLHAGPGEYRVTVRLPSTGSAEQFYDVARFEVVNRNPIRQRDIAFTVAGVRARLAIAQPKAGYVQADGVVRLEGTLPGAADGTNLMLSLEKGGQTWRDLVPVRGDRFGADVPLYFGPGPSRLTILLPEPGRADAYVEAADLLVENTRREVWQPIRRFREYHDHGIRLSQPLGGGERSGLTYRIAGAIDPEAPHAPETTHLVAFTEKDGQEAGYLVPVRGGRFEGLIWLRFGPGPYRVRLAVPDRAGPGAQEYLGAAEFTLIGDVDRDQRYLLPSLGVEADAPEIRRLAGEVTAGKVGGREKAHAIYEWVARNIAYDVEKYLNGAFAFDDGALKTLRERKGVCQDYAYLTVALLRAAGVEARLATGQVRSNRWWRQGSHAWVEARVEGAWISMDPTWGAGYVAGDRFVARYDPAYFDPDAAIFKKTHQRSGTQY